MGDSRTYQQLVTGARAGDLDAMDQLVRLFQDQVYALAYSRLRDHHLAEDVAQATLVQAILSLKSLRQPQALPAWLRRIAVSCCGRVGRRGRHVPLTQGMAERLVSGEPLPHQRLEQSQTRDELSRALVSLSSADRETLTLFYIQGLSVRHVAGWLGISEPAAKKRLHSARARLKERMIDMMKDDVSAHLPSRDGNLSRTVRDMLLQLCRDGLEQRFPHGDEAARQRWLEEAHQLDEEAGQSFWQIAWQVVQYMRQHDIPFGPGNERLPSSLLAYLLGVSTVNPLEFGLTCARDPEPDRPHVAFSVGLDHLDDVEGFVLASWPNRVARFDRWPGKPYRGLYVASRPLAELGFTAGAKDWGGVPFVTAEDRQRLVDMGAVSVTLMGFRTITQMHRTCSAIAAGGTRPPDLSRLDWADLKPLAVLSAGVLDEKLDLLDWNVIVRHRLMQRVQPQCFAELMAVLALAYRARKMPALVDEYIRRKQGQPWTVPPSLVGPQLDETYGLLIYDEQYVAILSGLTGWPMWSEKAWELGDALCTKDEPKTAALKAEVFAAATDHGIAPADASAVWDILTASNGLFYCKAAAVGYAVTVFQAAYLQAHFPMEFNAAAGASPGE